MAAFNPKLATLLTVIAASTLGLPPDAARAAAHSSPQLPIALDAQSSELDMHNNNVLFRKVHITQGNLSVTADQGQATGQATGLNFDNSLWVFRGNVKIAMEDGVIVSDDAEITFAAKHLAKAVVNGRPATFEQKVIKTGKLAKGHADSINYDINRAMVHFSKNAWISDGANEIRGESLKYNVAAQSIIAEASEQSQQRVHIIITPPPSKP